MHKSTWILTGAALLALLLSGCSPDDPEQLALDITQPEGTAALERYVAIGNSLTAGFMDGGLIMDGQAASYPLQIAAQLGYDPADPGAENWFAQPLIAWPGIGSTALSDPAYVAGVLHWDGVSIAVVDSTELASVQSQLLLAAQYTTPYDNLGIPGATLTDVTEALGSTTSQSPGNRFFDFILRNPTFGDKTMLEQAISLGPTLVTLWIGNNDVLGGATSGEPEVGVNITPPSAFAALLEGIVTELIDGVERRFGYTPFLVVGNIPATVDGDALTPEVPFFLPKAVFDQVVGVTYPTVETDVTHVLFPALGLVQGGFSDPLPEHLTLTADEAQVIINTTDAYNQAIDDLAAEHGFAVADVAAALGELTAAERSHFVLLLGQGLDEDTAAATTVYSLDGIHPNTKGQSRIANVFIEAINSSLELDGSEALIPVHDVEWDPSYPAPPQPGKLGGLAAGGR